MRQRAAHMDIGIFIASLFMLGFGVVLVYSSSFAVAQDRFGGADFFLDRQVIRALLGLLCFVVFINVDYHVWGKASSIAFLVALALLVVVLALPDSHAVNGAKRWVTLGGVRFQVSEFAWMALVALIAKRCDEAGEQIREWRRLRQNLVKVALVCGLVLMEPNFSTAALIGCVGIAMLFVAGARFRHIGSIFLLALPVAAVGMLSTGYRRARVMSYLHVSDHVKGIGYQAQQALIGLGNGGLFGVGMGQGKQKYFYLPEPHTDFAFSILGEEIGFVGLSLVLAVFGFIVYRGIRIAMNAPDRQGQLMAFGFTFVFALYVIVHASVNVGLIPTTGVPLPFLSYGGMSLVFTMSSIGILLNISSQTTYTTGRVVREQRERLSKYRP